MTSPILLVSELDEQILGDPSELENFRVWLEPHRRKLRLVYMTVEVTECVRELVDEGKLVAPDFVIAGAGTEVDCYASGKPVNGWSAKIPSKWDSERIRDVLAAFPELEAHPEMMQSRHKVSYFLEQASPRQLLQIEVALATAGLEADFSYVRNRFLDVRPPGVNKAAAVRLLAMNTSTPRSNTVVCGTSLGDLALYGEDYCGIVTANADAELRRQVPATVYQSSRKNAAGILDGLRYWIAKGQSSVSWNEWRFPLDDVLRRVQIGGDEPALVC